MESTKYLDLKIKTILSKLWGAAKAFVWGNIIALTAHK